MKEYFNKSKSFVALVLAVLVAFTMTPVQGVQAAVSAKATTYTVSGTITGNDTNKAVRNATVTLKRGTLVKTAKTDAYGKYSITGVAKATGYTLSVAATTYSTYNFPTFSVAANVAKNYKLATTKTFTVSGIIKNKATGKPVSGATVAIKGATSKSVKTTSTGAYSLTGVKFGTGYTMTVAATNYVTYTFPKFDLKANATKSYNTLAPLFTVAGTITDATTKKPVSGAKVVLKQGTTVRKQGTTSATGAYSLTGVAIGSNYTVEITATGYTKKVIPAFAVTNTNVTKSTTLAKVVTAYTVSGTITDAATKAPVAGAKVSLKQGTAVKKSGTTTATGTYSLTGVAAGSNYTVEITATDYTTKVIPAFAVTTANVVKSTTITKAVAAKYTVSGTVKDKVTTDLVVGASVKLMDGTTQVGTTQVTTATGAYSFANVPAKNGYTVVVTADNYTDYTSPAFNVSAATTQNVELTKTAAVTYNITGEITGSDMPTGLAATLQLKDSTGTSVGTAVTAAADGTYTIPSVEVGTGYTIVVTMMGYATGTISAFDVTNANVIDKDLVLAKVATYSVTGKITGSDAPTGIAATIQLKDSTGTAVGTAVTAAANGTYTIPMVSVGTGYTIAVTMTGYTAGNILAFNVVDANVTDKDLVLVKEIPTFTVAGKIIGSDTAGASGIAATLQLKNSAGVAVGTAVTAAADGTYTILAVPAGTGYTIAVTMATYDAGVIPTFSVVDANVIDRNLTLTKTPVVSSSISSLSVVDSTTIKVHFSTPQAGLTDTAFTVEKKGKSGSVYVANDDTDCEASSDNKTYTLTVPTLTDGDTVKVTEAGALVPAGGVGGNKTIVFRTATVSMLDATTIAVDLTSIRQAALTMADLNEFTLTYTQTKPTEVDEVVIVPTAVAHLSNSRTIHFTASSFDGKEGTIKVNGSAAGKVDFYSPEVTRVETVRTAGANANFNFVSHEAGKIFWVVVPQGNTPSKANVLAGKQSDGTTAAIAKNVSSTGDSMTSGLNTVAITGLSSNKAYDLYFVAQDSVATPNQMAAISAKATIDSSTQIPMPAGVYLVSATTAANAGEISLTAGGKIMYDATGGSDQTDAELGETDTNYAAIKALILTTNGLIAGDKIEIDSAGYIKAVSLDRSARAAAETVNLAENILPSAKIYVKDNAITTKLIITGKTSGNIVVESGNIDLSDTRLTGAIMTSDGTATTLTGVTDGAAAGVFLTLHDGQEVTAHDNVAVATTSITVLGVKIGATDTTADVVKIKQTGAKAVTVTALTNAKPEVTVTSAAPTDISLTLAQDAATKAFLLLTIDQSLTTPLVIPTGIVVTGLTVNSNKSVPTINAIGEITTLTSNGLVGTLNTKVTAAGHTANVAGTGSIASIVADASAVAVSKTLAIGAVALNNPTITLTGPTDATLVKQLVVTKGATASTGAIEVKGGNVTLGAGASADTNLTGKVTATTAASNITLTGAGTTGGSTNAIDVNTTGVKIYVNDAETITGVITLGTGADVQIADGAALDVKVTGAGAKIVKTAATPAYTITGVTGTAVEALSTVNVATVITTEGTVNTVVVPNNTTIAGLNVNGAVSTLAVNGIITALTYGSPATKTILGTTGTITGGGKITGVTIDGSGLTSDITYALPSDTVSMNPTTTLTIQGPVAANSKTLSIIGAAKNNVTLVGNSNGSAIDISGMTATDKTITVTTHKATITVGDAQDLSVNVAAASGVEVKAKNDKTGVITATNSAANGFKLLGVTVANGSTTTMKAQQTASGELLLTPGNAADTITVATSNANKCTKIIIDGAIGLTGVLDLDNNSGITVETAVAAVLDLSGLAAASTVVVKTTAAKAVTFNLVASINAGAVTDVNINTGSTPATTTGGATNFNFTKTVGTPDVTAVTISGVGNTNYPISITGATGSEVTVTVS